jgi:hypothetical protein
VNYDRRQRARAIEKFTTFQVCVIAVVALLVAASQDRSPEMFRWMLLAACVLGSVGVAAYSRVRVRGHRRLLRNEMDGDDRPTFSPASLWRVLREDRNYAAFMLSMFVIGTGNIMLTAPLTLTLADQFGLDALSSMIITSALPYLVIPWALPFWSRLLAARHVVRFRVIHSWVFVVSQSVVLISAVTGTLGLMYISAMFQGIAMAGGEPGVEPWAPGLCAAAPGIGVHGCARDAERGARGAGAAARGVAVQGLHRWHAGAEHWVFAFAVALCVVGGAWVWTGCGGDGGSGAGCGPVMRQDEPG